MLLPILSIVLGIALLVWSADRFVDGASASAQHFGVPPLLIGMVIVGFGTSAPELLVSGLAASEGKSGLALGNAYGSNISNIGLILGLTALICPIAVQSRILKIELPVLAALTGFAGWQVIDGFISRNEAIALLTVFALMMAWSIRQGLRTRGDALEVETESELKATGLSLKSAMFWLVVGLLLMMASSQALVWGAIQIAKQLGVSDLIIGLTIVAIGTSLPELASSLVASKRGEPDIALGNVLGSNMFNTLAVVGLAGVINPINCGSEAVYRDVPVMAVMTLSLFVLGYGFKGPGRINRFEGLFLLLCYVAYTGYLIYSIFQNPATS